MIKVLTLDEHWYLQLTMQPMALKVHSIFVRAINLVDSQGRLYTLAAKQVMGAPDTLVLDCLTLNRLCLAVGMSVFCDHRTFVLGHREIRIDLTKVTRWRCNLPRYQPIAYEWIDDLCTNVLATHVKKEDFASPSMFEKLSYAHIDGQANVLLEAVKEQDHAAFQKVLTSYFGLGIGLTPSGDDFVLGLCASLSVYKNPAKEYYALCQNAIYQAQLLTNIISYAALYNAAKGRFNAHIVHLLCHLFEPVLDRQVYERQLRSSLNNLLQIGSSSGADILKGLKFGLLLINFLADKT